MSECICASDMRQSVLAFEYVCIVFVCIVFVGVRVCVFASV